MRAVPGQVTYWREGDAIQNMGDYLSELFLLELSGGPLLPYVRIRLVGSVLSDFIVKRDLGASFGDRAAAVGYWGCGLRDAHSLHAELRGRCHFHGIRGPRSRDQLGLPADTPLGDPALLLPLLHTPRPAATLAGRSICVPHINDTVSDQALMVRTGVDAIVRPALPRSIDALLRAIDAIASAEFVLAGALHAAIIACAYGRPFAYLENGYVDLPFKWLDFSASVDIPTVFSRHISEARRAWENLVAPALRRPRLAPILRAFPGTLKPGVLERAMAWDRAAG